MSTNHDYVPYDPKSPIARDIEDFLEKIQSTPALLHYLKCQLAIAIQGNFGDEKIYIWYGAGRNGKSKIVELMQNALGDYATPLPSQVLTQKRPLSNSPSPEIARTKGRRFINANEPDTGDQFNLGILKELTGGDKLIARFLNQNPFEFRPQHHLVYLVNVLPDVKSQDDGTWGRIRVVPFGSKFVRNPSKPGEYMIDEEIPLKIPSWGQTFISMLIDYFLKHCKGKRVTEPEEVMKMTNHYREFSDMYKQFFEEKIEYDESDPSEITLGDVYQAFKEWFKLSFANGKNCPSMPDVKEYLRKNFSQNFNSTTRKLSYHKIKEEV